VSADDIAAVREWVGSDPDDDTVEAELDRWVDDPHPVERAALAILRVRLADVLAGPAKWAEGQDYSEDWSSNLKLLQGRVARLEGIVGADADLAAPTVAVGQLVRPERDRTVCRPRRR